MKFKTLIANEIAINVLETKLLTDDEFVNKTYITSKTIRQYIPSGVQNSHHTFIPFDFRKIYDKFDVDEQNNFINKVNGHIALLKAELLNTLDKFKS